MANMIRWEFDSLTQTSTAKHRGWSITVRQAWAGWNWVAYREPPNGEKMYMACIEQTRGAAMTAAVNAVNERKDAT